MEALIRFFIMVIFCSGMFEEDGIVLDLPPQFTMRLRDRRVQVTYPVRLTCQVIGFPYPEVTWFRDGTELVHDGEFQCR